MPIDRTALLSLKVYARYAADPHAAAAGESVRGDSVPSALEGIGGTLRPHFVALRPFSGVAGPQLAGPRPGHLVS